MVNDRTGESPGRALLSTSAQATKANTDWLVAEGVKGWKTIHGTPETVLRLRMLAT